MTACAKLSTFYDQASSATRRMKNIPMPVSLYNSLHQIRPNDSTKSVNKMSEASTQKFKQTNPEKWDMVIGPQRNLFDLRLGELWHARDLIMLFVRRDFVAGYKQTILGPLWYLIQPLLTTITFTVIFGNIAKLPTDGLPPFLFYMSGTVIFA